MKPSQRLLPLALAILLPATGCELFEGLFSQNFQFPIDMETPTMDLNVTDQVNAIEDALCSDADSYNCAVVKALDYSDDEEISDPPRIPDEFPVEVDVVDPVSADTESVNAEEWASDVGLTSDLDLKAVVPMDVTSLLGGNPPEAIEDVNVTVLALSWKENTFTFDTAPMNLYVADELIADVSDPDRLLEEGQVQLVGTVPARDAGGTGDVPVEFVDGGKEIFNAALKGLRFTLLLALPEDANMSLREGAGGPGTRVKPTGDASVTVKATLEYTLNGAAIAALLARE
jgi:hypothetical protein